MWSLSFAPLPSPHLPLESPQSQTLKPIFPISSTPNPKCRFTPCGCSSSTAISIPPPPPILPAPVAQRRKRYRKSYPGESIGITEEMRFVAMRLRNDGKPQRKTGKEGEEKPESEEAWAPTMEGFMKFLVDSKVVFDALERIVDQSDDVAYAYFRNTGLERSKSLSKDIEQFGQLGFVIPESSSPGATYAAYLKEVASNSVPSFLSHFYNIYFGHVTGGKAIGKQVSNKILYGRELEFYKWDSDELELLKGVREKLNKVGEHWSRDEKNKCLKETTKCFRYVGQIVRLIIL